MKITHNYLRVLIREALSDMGKADFIGSGNASELRTFEQVQQDYLEWAKSPDGQKLLELIKDPSNHQSLDSLLASLSSEDISIPSSSEDYIFAISNYIYELGEAVLGDSQELRQLVFNVDPEFQDQGLELFDTLIASIDEFNLGVDFNKYQQAKKRIEAMQGTIEKPRKLSGHTTDGTFAAMQQVTSNDNQVSTEDNNVGLYLIKIELTKDAEDDVRIWTDWFAEYLSVEFAVIGMPITTAQLSADDGNSLVYLVVAQGDDNNVHQQINDEIDQISLDMFFDQNNNSAYYEFIDSNDTFIAIADKNFDVDIAQLVVPGDFNSLKDFVGKTGYGLVDFEEYTASEFNELIPKSLNIIWDINKGLVPQLNNVDPETMKYFAHQAGEHLVNVVNELDYLEYDLEYTG